VTNAGVPPAFANKGRSIVDHTTTSIAEFAANLSFEGIPGEVVHAVKQRLVDSIACAMGGYHCPAAREGARAEAIAERTRERV
jgi:2-methylcitrate dehydratase PrpD